MPSTPRVNTVLDNVGNIRFTPKSGEKIPVLTFKTNGKYRYLDGPVATAVNEYFNDDRYLQDPYRADFETLFNSRNRINFIFISAPESTWVARQTIAYNSRGDYIGGVVTFGKPVYVELNLSRVLNSDGTLDILTLKRVLGHEAGHSLARTGAHAFYSQSSPITEQTLRNDSIYFRDAERGWLYQDPIIRRNGAIINPGSSGYPTTREAYISKFLEERAAYFESRRVAGKLKSGVHLDESLSVDELPDFKVNWDPVASIIGSKIGEYLFKDLGIVGEIAGGSIIGTLAQNIAQSIQLYGTSSDRSGSISSAADSAFSNFSQELGQAFRNAAVGSVSSFLTLEIGEALGLDGFGAELFNVAGSTLLGKVLNNSIDIANGVQGVTVFSGLNSSSLFGVNSSAGGASLGLASSSIGSFLGAKLGSLIISPTNTEGAILSSIGSSVGGYLTGAAFAGVVAGTTSGAGIIGGLASAIFKTFGEKLGSVIAPGVGTLIGFVLGALIGKLFGRKKPRIPTANAEVTLNVTSGQWGLGAIASANNGNRNLVTNMASAARDTINGLLGYVAGGEGAVEVANIIGENQRYGHTGSDVWFDVRSGSSWSRQYAGRSADVAVEMGALAGVRATKIVGNDLILKRALYGSSSKSVVALLGDLQVAQDYGFYLRNLDIINAQIRDDPLSDVSVGWLVTLARANELRLDRVQHSDFFGGMRGFITSIDATGFAPVYENYTFRDDDRYELQGSFSSVTLPGSYEGYIAFQDQDLYNAGFSLYGWGTNRNDIVDAQWTTGGASGTFDGYGGDDIILGSGQLFGSAGYDWLSATLPSLMDGGSEDDVLLGSYGSDRMLGGTGNDYISGGWGDDYFFDASRTWGGYGGEGNDTLVGNAGMDSNYGENGDDTFIVDQDGGNVWDVHEGQAGLDSLSFERFTAGVWIDFATLGGWSWNPSAKYIYGDVVSNIENLTGSQFDDILLADSGGNVIRGLGGNDTIFGREGDDILDGGAGADQLNGGPGGNNTASYENSSAGVVVNLTTGAALGGDANGDTFTEMHNLRGSRYNDELTGTAGDNRLEGRRGDDIFRYTGGNDVVDGGDGFDILDVSTATGALTVSDGYYATISGFGTSYLTSVEGFVGTAFADNMSGTAADESYEGGGGNDYMVGSSGSDIYVFGLGDGYDSVEETTDAANSIVLKEGIDWRNVSILGAGSSGSLTVQVRSTGEYITTGTNFSYVTSGANAGNHNHKIKSLDLGGVSVVDIDMIDWTPAGAANEASTYVYGGQNKADVIFAYGGDDTIFAAGSYSAYESRGNLIYAGDGTDYIYSSYGDDQYIFERGNGFDTLTDMGGIDTIIMGPSVNPEDVIYQVVVTGGGEYGGEVADLYIGLRDPNNPSLSASQVADRIRIPNGATRFEGVTYGTQSFNTIEHVRVGGQEIDLMKADINWTTAYYQDYTGGGPIPPIAIDLDGDGIELRSVEGSRITTTDADGNLFRMGWIGKDDGFLALDRNGDGSIDRLGEISFINDVEGAKTDLEGLAAYDSNGDGKFDASDARWKDFRIWQDKNQDGIGTKKELMSLDEVGIKSISLKGDPTGFTKADGIDNVVTATTAIEWADPNRIGRGYDVALAVYQVRADNGGREAADEIAKAKGKPAADTIDARLFGIAALSAEEVEAAKGKDKKAKPGDDAGLLGRVETFLTGASKKDDGSFGLTVVGADAAHAKNRKDAKDVDEGKISDRFADDEWTREGSQALVERDRGGDDVFVTVPELTDGQKADLDKAKDHFDKLKKREEADAADLAARDAALAKDPAPTPIPDAAELADLKARDPFRLLTADTDEETQKKLDDEKKRQEETEAAGPQETVNEATAATGMSQADSSQRATMYSKEPVVQEVFAAQTSGPHEVRSGSDRPLSLRAPIDADVPDELGYDVRIQVANARLIQALGSFGEAPTMMAQYRGLNVSEGDALPGWLTVNHQPSVHGFAALR